MMTAQPGREGLSPTLLSEPFGQTPDGHAAALYTLQSECLRVHITDFGGRMVRIETPDRHGHQGNVLLGFDSVRTYITAGGAFGARWAAVQTA